ncbi:retrotransposon ty1-copia subclass [Lasius niger]|uniref:Retrotransposon ty1-copia subclass n=1 Tax=Lasius niger TaxID=67767 RepID=A0A0J7N8W3_LASNI|nr:retrotransposon ty1-copia subclass [Lasius niger]
MPARYEIDIAEYNPHIVSGSYEQPPRPRNGLKLSKTNSTLIQSTKLGRLYLGKTIGNLSIRSLDYTETFSPVVRYDTLRTLLAVMTEKDLELVQFGVRTAFLYGELREEIYMEVPEGLVVKNKEKQDVVCKLNRSLYD